MVNFKVAARDGFLSFALIAVFLTPLLVVELAPAAEGPIMVVTDPFSALNAVEVIAAAQGGIVGSGRWPWIAVGTSSDPDFQARLRAAGALLLLPPLKNACQANLAL
jgi:hypothetical protein